MNKISLIILIIVLGGLILGFVYWFQYVKPKAEVLTQLKIEKEASLSFPEEKPLPSCEEFPKIEGEISCEEAIKIAQAQYPGEIKIIEKQVAFWPVGVLPEVEIMEKEVWLIGINLKKPIKMHEKELKSIKVFVDKETGALEIDKIMSGEL